MIHSKRATSEVGDLASAIRHKTCLSEGNIGVALTNFLVAHLVPDSLPFVTHLPDEEVILERMRGVL